MTDDSKKYHIDHIDQLKIANEKLKENISQYQKDIGKYENAISQMSDEYNFDADEYFVKYSISELNNMTKTLFTKIITQYRFSWTDYFEHSRARNELLKEIESLFALFISRSISKVPNIIKCYYVESSQSEGLINDEEYRNLSNTNYYNDLINAAVKIIFKNIFINLFAALNDNDKEYVKQDGMKCSTLDFVNKLYGKLTMVTIEVFMEDPDLNLFITNKLSVSNRTIKDFNSDNCYDYKSNNGDYFLNSIVNLFERCIYDSSINDEYYKMVIKYLHPESDHYNYHIASKLSCRSFIVCILSFISIKGMGIGGKFSTINDDFSKSMLPNELFTQLVDLAPKEQKQFKLLDIFEYSMIGSNAIELCDKKEDIIFCKDIMIEYSIYNCSMIQKTQTSIKSSIVHFYNSIRDASRGSYDVKDSNSEFYEHIEKTSPLYDRFKEVLEYYNRGSEMQDFYNELYNMSFKYLFTMLYSSKNQDINKMRIGFSVRTAYDMMSEFFQALKDVLHKDDAVVCFQQSEDDILKFVSNINFDYFKDMTLEQLVYKDIIRLGNEFVESNINKLVEYYQYRKEDQDQQITTNPCSEIYLNDEHSSKEFKYKVEVMSILSDTLKQFAQECNSYDYEDIKKINKRISKLKLYY